MRMPTFLLTLLAGACFGFTAQAQDLPQMQLKVIGLQSHLNSFKAGEKPFWEEQLPKDSGGKITAQLTAQDLSGDITVVFTKVPDLVRVSDSSGNITLVFPPGPTAYRVSASTSSGSTSVNVPQSLTSPHVISATGQSGNITITQ